MSTTARPHPPMVRQSIGQVLALFPTGTPAGDAAPARLAAEAECEQNRLRIEAHVAIGQELGWSPSAIVAAPRGYLRRRHVAIRVRSVDPTSGHILAVIDTFAGPMAYAPSSSTTTSGDAAHIVRVARQWAADSQASGRTVR